MALELITYSCSNLKLSEYSSPIQYARTQRSLGLPLLQLPQRDLREVQLAGCKCDKIYVLGSQQWAGQWRRDGGAGGAAWGAGEGIEIMTKRGAVSILDGRVRQHMEALANSSSYWPVLYSTRVIVKFATLPQRNAYANRLSRDKNAVSSSSAASDAISSIRTNNVRPADGRWPQAASVYQIHVIITDCTCRLEVNARRERRNVQGTWKKP
ncbi:hypothetical protein BDZ91DRAFT_762174 [Kalaharituber pfeilii]|nr:hypothetical protein BDZ91DRAFT_762174 [Kalaharituber pfeilii]